MTARTARDARRTGTPLDGRCARKLLSVGRGGSV